MVSCNGLKARAISGARKTRPHNAPAPMPHRMPNVVEFTLPVRMDVPLHHPAKRRHDVQPVIDPTYSARQGGRMIFFIVPLGLVIVCAVRLGVTGAFQYLWRTMREATGS